MKTTTIDRPETRRELGQRRQPQTQLVSVIVPVSERPEPLTELYREYSQVLREQRLNFEFVFVGEPWRAESLAALSELIENGQPVRTLVAPHTVGEARLFKLGAAHARGSILVTLPAYRRIESSALPGLIEDLDEDVDLVVARRWPRGDSLINRFQNRVFHFLIAPIGGGKIRDVACGVRVMRQELLERIPLYGDFYRFFPLLAVRDGCRVKEKDCAQHPNDCRTRIYSPGIYLRRLLDVLGLFFLLRFTEKPLRFFGLIGSLVSVLGGGLLAVLFAQRLSGQGIADRPLLLLGVLLVVLGIQAVALGLIGEMIVYLSSPQRRVYRIRSADPPRAGNEP